MPVPRFNMFGHQDEREREVIGMGSINDVIDVLRQAPTNVDRGTLFEKLMVRYFELDPALTQQYDAVWRWIDWPDRKGKTDTGIDLVARERDTGEYTAIQCKFYEPTHTLSKGDIDSFFTASGKKPFTNRVIISTTDKWGKNAEDALDDQTTPVQRINMADIAESRSTGISPGRRATSPSTWPPPRRSSPARTRSTPSTRS